MLRNKFYLEMGGNLSSLVTYNVLKIDRFISFDKLVKLLFMAILFQRDDKFWHGVDTVTDDMMWSKIKKFLCHMTKKLVTWFQLCENYFLAIQLDCF